jgi:G:T-mismatch repair DNA endonuclease (very short patch repair protein)
MDNLTREERSVVMSKLRSKVTKPELKTSYIIHKTGCRLRPQKTLAVKSDRVVALTGETMRIPKGETTKNGI